MKLKRLSISIFLLLLLLPFMVKAETCDIDKMSISSVEIKEKSDNVVEVNKPTIDGAKINLDLNMSEVGDKISYKVVVKNDSNYDFELDEKNYSGNSDYIVYTFESSDNSFIVSAKSSKEFYLNAEYKNKVPTELLVGGKHDDSKELIVSLSSNNDVKNPDTSDSLIIILIAALLVLGVFAVVMIKKKQYAPLALLIMLSATIPLTVYALCKYEITVTSKVNITSDEYYIYYIGTEILANGMTVLPSTSITEDAEGNPLETEIKFYDTYQETNQDMFIRYLVSDNAIRLTQVGFIAGDKAYFVTGGGATESNGNNSWYYYNDDSVHFNQNLEVLNEAFDLASDCEIELNEGSGVAACYTDDFRVRIGTRGNATVTGEGIHCRASDDETSRCDYDA